MVIDDDDRLPFPVLLPIDGELGTEDGLRNAVDVLDGVRACSERELGS